MWERKYIIWSNENLDTEDWKESFKEYIEMNNLDIDPNDEEELYKYMVETNDEYLSDERINLNINVPDTDTVLVIADLGLWNGRCSAYREIHADKISDCLYTDRDTDYTTWYLDNRGDFCCDQIHHDGTNHLCFRAYKPNMTEAQKENLKAKLYMDTATRADITRVTQRLGDEIAKVYGWDIPKSKTESENDFDMPLFNKELSREEFDRKVRENPINDHLKVSVLPAKEKAVTGENKSQNDTETEQNFAPNTSYNDAFFLDDESQTVTWIYYNPDSNSGGQYVTNTLSYDDVIEAASQCEGVGDFFDYLGSIADQTLADVGTEWFEEAENAFSQTPDYTECTPETIEALIDTAERDDMVVTNIGKVPIEEYREIVAFQNGFDSYDEMYNEGIRIRNGYDKEPEPIVPAKVASVSAFCEKYKEQESNADRERE